MRQILPLVPMKVDVKNINLNRAITWWNPDQKDWMKGVADLKSMMSLPWPSQEGWWKAIRSEGKLQVRGFALSTLNLEEKFQEALSGLPGTEEGEKGRAEMGQVGKEIPAEVDLDYKAQNEKIEIKKLSFKTPQKNDLWASGEVGFDFQGSLKGELALSNPPVKGSVREANSDEQGRLVVPLELSGDLLNPSFGVATHIIEKMLAKTVAYEQKKTVAKVETKVKDEKDKIVAKEKKKAKESIDKKIKGLFNRK